MASKSPFGFEWDALPDSETAGGWKFFTDDLDKRMQAVKKMMVYIAAQELLTHLKDKIPDTDEYDDLRDSLTLSEIPGKEPGYSVHASMKHRKVRKVDQARTVLYVRAKRGLLNPTPERIKFLEDYGPWTTDTIPFWPSKKLAVVVQRQVTKREADQIAKMQDKQKSKTAMEMQRLGVKEQKKGGLASQRSRRNKAVPDTSFAALQLEYGGPGHRPVPAWRVGVGEVMRTGIKAAPRKYKELKQTFTDPYSNKWKRWPKVKDKVKVREARGFAPFMKKLGFL